MHGEGIQKEQKSCVIALDCAQIEHTLTLNLLASLSFLQGIMCCLSLLLRALALAESSSPAKCDPKMKVTLNYPPSSEGWVRSRELNRLSLSAWQWT